MNSENDIYVLGKRVWLRQPEKGFRISLDSVMLAAACPAKEGETLLDLGCGVGGAGLCVLARVGEINLTGIDIQPQCIELAALNAEKNRYSDICTFQQADAATYETKERFKHIICNPPYLDSGTHMPSPYEHKALSMGSENPGIEVWIDAAFRSLKSGGSFTIIHRADMLDKILQAFGKRFGSTEIIPLWPKANQPAKRVIVKTTKDRRSPASLHPGITLHNEDGSNTEEAENILRHAGEI